MLETLRDWAPLGSALAVAGLLGWFTPQIQQMKMDPMGAVMLCLSPFLAMAVVGLWLQPDAADFPNSL